MNRFWSILFFFVPLLAIATFVLATSNTAPLSGLQLPRNISQQGQTIDHLYNVFHLLAASILLATGLFIGWVLWRFDHRRVSAARYVHANTKLEIVWSVIPGLILVFLAAYQMQAWADNKINRPTINVDGRAVPKPPLVIVKAKQFGWEFFYAGRDERLGTQDDIYIENLLVVPVDEDVVLQLESRDVIHSFSVAQLRLKQDIVPGMTHFSWFHATEVGQIEIACTELCGWGHYKMKGIMRITTRAEFDAWINEQIDFQRPKYDEP